MNLFHIVIVALMQQFSLGTNLYTMFQRDNLQNITMRQLKYAFLRKELRARDLMQFHGYHNCMSAHEFERNPFNVFMLIDRE